MIDRELAAFLEEGIGIQIGTRDASLAPNGARVVVTRAGDTLFVATGPGPRRRMFAVTEQTFTARGVDFRYTFQRDSTGLFSTLVISNNGSETIARRTVTLDAPRR